ncbi:ROK family protein [Agromyces mangrovi Wang et al. 2018]|uniref:ROK family protein n=1 Tax=Agromyces mangrovi TaxID=1858653 RepID=UPI0025723E25|nr:ROK family protein [Agromyces mangrovi]BDZ65202.1 sugar kinase [Agromyces mangrovi]
MLVDRHGVMLAEARRPTTSPDPAGAGVLDVAHELVKELGGDGDLRVGVVVPGIVDEARGIAVRAVNLGWEGLDLARMLSSRIGRDVAFGHDVRAGAVAEARWGAASGTSGTSGVVVYVAIGTGVAAAVLVEGRPVVSDGWAGEIGQLPVADGPLATRRMEEVASAAALAHRAGLPNGRAVAERAAAGDPQARAAWDDAIGVLADAFAAVTAVVAPELIVVGGGLSRSGDQLLVPLADALDERLGTLRRPRLRTATFGEYSSAFGAAALALGRA